MFKILRMIFAIVAAIFVALCVPAGIFWDMIAVWCCVGGALLFFALSMLFKYFQEEKEKNNKNADDASSANGTDAPQKTDSDKKEDTENSQAPKTK